MSGLSSVRFRLALWNVGVLAVILAIFGYALRLKIESDLIDGVDGALEQSGYRAQQSIDFTGHLPQYMTDHGILMTRLHQNAPTNGVPSAVSQQPQLLYTVAIIDIHGRAVEQGHPVWDQSTVGKSLTGDSVYSTITVGGIHLRIYSVPIYLHKKIGFVLQIVRPLTQVYGEVENVTRGLFTLIPLALAIVGAGALLLTERALLPVRDIVSSTELIEAKNLSGRLQVTGKDEFSHLAITINGMLGRLDKAFNLLRDASEKQRRFTADASHELRTPLTIIKANTSLALSSERTPDEYRRTLSAVDRAADRMSKIVMDLLYIARSDAGEVFITSEPVKLQSIVKQSIEAVADVYEHIVNVEVDTSYWVSGDEESLVRLFANLLQNAYRYTLPGGTITFRAEKRGEKCIVYVIDRGVGIAEEHIEHLGERFFRVDDARSRDGGGTGLGLAICRSIVESHDGSIDFSSVVGEGTTVTVSLPATEKPLSGRNLEAAAFEHV